MNMNPEVMKEMNEAEVIFVNHSGGKDSQAMMAQLIRLGFRDKLVVVHADLGEMEWEPMHKWIESTSFGVDVHVVKSDQDFFELCRKYGRLPSGQARFCTDFLKTKPCEKFMVQYCEERGITKAVSAIGIRAEESPARAKKPEIKAQNKMTSDRKSKISLNVVSPIFKYTLEEVKEEIAAAGQDLHWVYGKGYSRLSCAFCVFGRINEHKQAAKDRPELFKKMVELERELGKTIRIKQKNKVKYPKFLDEYISTDEAA